MSDFFEENSENTVPAEEKASSDVSLNDRKEQLEYKVNKEMDQNRIRQEEFRDRASSYSDFAYKNTSYSNSSTGRNYGSSAPSAGHGVPPAEQNVNYSQVKSGLNSYNGPYGYTNDYTNGVPYYAQPPRKKPMKTATKSYIGLIIALTVIFVAGFGAECARNAGSSNIFDFIDSDLDDDFGYFFDSDSDEDFFDKYFDTDSDSAVYSSDDDKDIIAPPEPDSVINDSAGPIKAQNQPSDIDSSKYNAKTAYKAVEKSVVSVVTYMGDVGVTEDAAGEGTGIIVTSDGYIVTNSHVISDTKDIGVEVITSDGVSYAGIVVGYDSRTDLALVKINAENLSPVTFVNSDQIEVGQDALAIGNPGGVIYSNSLTKGAVSALNRTVSSNSMVSYIQTDAAINPGNSGGPLLNIAGQVMGINTIKIADTDYEGMGFAIPSNTVIEIVNDLMTQGYVSGRVRIGIMGQAVSPYLASIYDVPRGIMIDDFMEDSPFNGTEAKVDDIITAINNEKIDDFSDLYSELAKYEPGQKVTVTLFRANRSSSGGKSFEVEVTLLADKGETQNK